MATSKKHTKLTPAQVASIRKMWETGRYSQTAIAAKYGVTQGHVSNIVNGLARVA